MTAVLVNLGALAGALLLLALSPGADGTYGVLAGDGEPAWAVVARAGGRLVRVSDSGRTAVAQSDAGDFRGRLLAGGALIVFNPALAYGCASPSETMP